MLQSSCILAVVQQFQNVESSVNCNLFFFSYHILYLGVELNLHGLKEKENEHFLVNTGTAYFHQTGSFVMGEESF